MSYRQINIATKAGVVIMLLVLTILGFYGYSQLNKLNELRNSLKHTNDIVLILRSMFEISQDAETGQRGFIISVRETYLAPYKQALSKATAELKQLHYLTANNPEQNNDFAILEKSVNEKFGELSKTIELRRAKGFEAAQEMILTDVGKNQMDTIRAILNRMLEREYQDLINYNEEQEQRTERAFLWLFTICIIAIIFQITMGLITLKFIKGENLAQTTLKASEEQLRLILSAISDYAIFMLDPEGRIVSWNEGAQRINGYTEQEIIGKHFSILFSEIDKAKDKPTEELKRALQSGFYEEEGQRVRKDGSKFWANIIIRPIYNQFSRLTGYVKVTRDITERKQAADKDKEQAELLQLTRDAVIVRDLDGTIRYWNRGAENVYGFKEQEAIGQVSHSLLRTKFPQPLVEIEKTIGSQGHWEGEVLQERSNGQRIIVSSRHVLKTDAQGKAAGVLEINTDITVQKQSEQRKMALAEMKRVNTELEQFASIASHDLQEPLRAVAGCLQILGKTYKGKLGQDADELIGHAVDGASRMHTLINNLLSLSRVSSSPVALEPVDLTEAFDQALKNLEISIKETGAVITHEPLPIVTGQKTQLIQLFQNLISNAIKFCSNKTPNIHVSVSKTNDINKWQICVSDNGIGFKQEYSDKIFQPFKRLHGGGEYPGTGIGLAICKTIVEKHGGTIWAESEPNIGTKFCFTIIDTGMANET